MPAGRPLLHTPESLQKGCLAYLERCIETNKVPTKAGLLLELKISRETYREYKERDEFVDTIKECELIIEDSWNQKLVGSGATGPIFYLKNAFKEDYRDSQDITSDGKPIINNVEVSFKNPVDRGE